MKQLQLIMSTLLFGLSLSNYVAAQDITFAFANAQTTNDGTDDYYEVDVTISSTTDFKLGSGLLYFNYNTAAFGTNVKANANIEFTYPNGSYILGEHEKNFNFGDLYNSYISNDNTTSRVAFSWQQNYSSAVYTGNVTSTAANLFHIKIKFVDVNEDPSFCFETGAVFLDQTYTACGSTSSDPLTTADCTNFPGSQIFNDNFDCSAALLPVELLYFTAAPYNDDVLLNWQTATEINNDYFEVERSTDGIRFEKIGQVAGAGTTTQNQFYELIDDNPITGENYYRLRQVDFDGKFEYSTIQVVVFEKEYDTNITTFPNPVRYTLNVESNQANIAHIQIFNSLGQIVYEQHSLTATNLHQIDVENLSSGIYYVKVNDTNEMIKFVKK